MEFLCSRGLACQGTWDILGYRCPRRRSNRDLEQRAMEKRSYACAPEGSLTVNLRESCEPTPPSESSGRFRRVELNICWSPY